MPYTFNRTITIQGSGQVPSTQTNFPVLVYGTYAFLKTVGNGGNVQSTSGYDIIFTSDALGATPLNFERVVWGASTGTVEFWILIPSLTATTVFYLWYGNSAVTTDQQSKTAVWTNSYASVMHQGDGSTTNFTDSTANANNGASGGAGPTAITAKIGGGSVCTGGSFVDIPDAASLKPATALTISCWWGPPGTGQGNFARVLQKGSAAAAPFASYGFFYNGTDQTNVGAILGKADSTSIQTFTGAGVVQTNVFQYLVATYDNPSGALKLYYNGTFKTSATGTTGAIFYDAQHLMLCNTPQNNFGNGTIDEFRLSSVVRSQDWITTEYNNQNAPASFYAVGSAVAAVTTAASGGASGIGNQGSGQKGFMA
jgi:hypothetical protein